MYAIALNSQFISIVQYNTFVFDWVHLHPEFMSKRMHIPHGSRMVEEER